MYVIYDPETTIIKGEAKTKPAAKAKITRMKKINPEHADYIDTFEVEEEHFFSANIEKTVTRTNLMTGKKFEEPINTPIHCSPAFESYWSM